MLSIGGRARRPAPGDRAAPDRGLRRAGLPGPARPSCSSRSARGNLAARALYDGVGFQATGRRHHYYRLPDGSFEDALVMCRDLVV
ncbi:MAG: hypothetical protein WDO24_26895 [Pseudomonadota bacterium]